MSQSSFGQDCPKPAAEAPDLQLLGIIEQRSYGDHYDTSLKQPRVCHEEEAGLLDPLGGDRKPPRRSKMIKLFMITKGSAVAADLGSKRLRGEYLCWMWCLW